MSGLTSRGPLTTAEVTAARILAIYCNVLLKGGHSAIHKGTDILFSNDQSFELQPSMGDFYAKHGSGCVLSSAIACQIALGNNIEQACKNAKPYIERILNSNPQLLAYHVQ